MDHAATAPARILKEHDLRLTEPRARILELFLRADHALPHHYLEQHLAEVDRVTIYRTLRTFVGSGILHTIPDETEGVKYALCDEPCSTHQHKHDHVHFTCRNCAETTCLDHIHVPLLNIPAGYTVENTSLIVQGLCPNCQ